jgi:hypothetical protein
MRTLLALLFVTFFVSAANAQVLGYGVAGPATTMGFVNHSRITFNAAGGVDVAIADRVGVGGELGFFNRLIVGSANATLHLGNRESLSRRSLGGGGKVSPFVTAGYSRFGIGDGEGGFSAFHAGAGAHVWLGDRAGLRLEIRDHLRPDDRGLTQYWSARVGIVLR